MASEMQEPRFGYLFKQAKIHQVDSSLNSCVHQALETVQAFGYISISCRFPPKRQQMLNSQQCFTFFDIFLTSRCSMAMWRKCLQCPMIVSNACSDWSLCCLTFYGIARTWPDYSARNWPRWRHMEWKVTSSVLEFLSTSRRRRWVQDFEMVRNYVNNIYHSVVFWHAGLCSNNREPHTRET